MQWLSPAKAGALKGVTGQTVRLWIKSGKVPADMVSKSGANHLIDPEKWARWEPSHNPNGGWVKGRPRKSGVTTH